MPEEKKRIRKSLVKHNNPGKPARHENPPAPGAAAFPAGQRAVNPSAGPIAHKAAQRSAPPQKLGGAGGGRGR
jgi:hypothetical protein